MKEKGWGTVLVVIAALTTTVSILVKLYMEVLKSCASCTYLPYMIVWFICGLMLAAGLMMRRSGEIDRVIAESSLKMNRELEEAKKKERQKEEFQKFLEGFSGPEKNLIELLHTYEGITLKELEKKAGLSKEVFHKTFKSLQGKEIVALMDREKAYLLRMSK
jgi:uncharacterized membrane protein